MQDTLQKNKIVFAKTKYPEKRFFGRTIAEDSYNNILTELLSLLIKNVRQLGLIIKKKAK